MTAEDWKLTLLKDCFEHDGHSAWRWIALDRGRDIYMTPDGQKYKGVEVSYAFKRLDSDRGVKVIFGKEAEDNSNKQAKDCILIRLIMPERKSKVKEKAITTKDVLRMRLNGSTDEEINAIAGVFKENNKVTKIAAHLSRLQVDYYEEDPTCQKVVLKKRLLSDIIMGKNKFTNPLDFTNPAISGCLRNLCPHDFILKSDKELSDLRAYLLSTEVNQ